MHLHCERLLDVHGDGLQLVQVDQCKQKRTYNVAPTPALIGTAKAMALRMPRTAHSSAFCLHHRWLLCPLEAVAGTLVAIVEQSPHVALVKGCR
jgi:hypothetical protein